MRPGEPRIALQLGRAIQEAGGPNADAAQTLRWLQSAADAGQVDAEHELGTRYASGDGVEQDMTKARSWL